MRFIFVPFGTAGDVLPYVGIGIGLKKRGHHVVVVTHTTFASLVQRHGLDHYDLDDLDLYTRTINHPDHWNPRRGLQMDAEFIVRDTMRKQYAALADLDIPGQTVAVTSHGGYGPRIAQDKLGIPLVSAHIAPILIRSVARPWTQPIADWTVRILPFRFEREWYFRFVDRFLADPLLGPELNRFRAELDLPPVRRIIHRWIQSPQLILGLFPHWLAEPLPEDWPPHVELTGFPLFDDANETLAPEVEAFLEAGEPPIVFTPGTGVAHARPFFEAALFACRQLGRRGLFLTRFTQQLPRDLPPTIRHEPFLPLSQVLPRAAAVVYHGGVGTMAQAVRAGIPQLLMPMNYDQPEHAKRLRRLGVGMSLSPSRFRGPAVAGCLDELLRSDDVRARCKELAGTLPAGDPVARTCDCLEAFAQRVGSRGDNGAISR